MAWHTARIGGTKRNQSGQEKKQFTPVVKNKPWFDGVAVKIEGLSSGERVDADSGVIKIVANMKLPLGHWTEHVRQATHGVQRETAQGEGGERIIKMIWQRIVIPHNITVPGNKQQTGQKMTPEIHRLIVGMKHASGTLQSRQVTRPITR